MSGQAGESSPDPSADRSKRRSVRLTGYDYSLQGTYFVTICTQDRLCLCGAVVGDEVSLNEAGQVVVEVWQDLPERFPAVLLDEFVLMPNHLHGIVVIRDLSPRGLSTIEAAEESPGPSLGEIVGAFKSLSTRRYGHGVRLEGWPTYRGRLWQRSYYEHVIRSDEALERIRRYIQENPASWSTDPGNPDSTG